MTGKLTYVEVVKPKDYTNDPIYIFGTQEN